MVGILWIFCSTFAVGIFPVWQGRKTIAHTVKSMYLDVTGQRKPILQGRVQAVEEEKENGTMTPDEKGVVKTG